MVEKMQILYVGSDFCSIKSLASVLPKSLLDADVKVDIVVPRYAGIDEGESPLALRLIDANVNVDNRDEKIRVYEGRRDVHIRAFYLDSERLHVRPGHTTDAEIIAAAVFAHAVGQLVSKIATRYDIVYCDGLDTALVPVIMRTGYNNVGRIAQAKIVQFLPGIADKASINMSYINRLGISHALASAEQMEFYGKLSILKGAYIYADKLIFPNDDVETLISNNRGKDIGMEGVLFAHADKLAHVQIGVPREHFSSSVSADNLAPKTELKIAYAKKNHLNPDARRALVAFIGRLDDHSGIDLVNDILDDLMDRKINLVIIGEGNKQYMDAVSSWTDEFRGNVAYISKRPDCKDVNDLLSAADVLLVPSQNESIDSIAIKAQFLGCIPVARAIGVSAASINPVKNIKKIAPDNNGFTFKNYDSDEFFDAAMDALDVYAQKDDFKQLQAQAIASAPCLCHTAVQLKSIFSDLLA